MVSAVLPTPPSPNTTNLYMVIRPAMFADCLNTPILHNALCHEEGHRRVVERVQGGASQAEDEPVGFAP